ncbi:MAG: PD-(D/E)XK nuclease family protein [Chloroflexota bacterium]|nr:PD-(D/E)XK nuclease family protein [Chloroflexota bacterium]
MILPTDLQFSQASLQDYVDCQRRFQLRYVQRVAWPAAEAEPAMEMENERYLRQGAVFHRLIHQHLLGIAPDKLAATVTDVDLIGWWRNYLEGGPSDLPPSRYPEVVLSAPLGGHRLVAKYDLIAVDAGRRASFGELGRAVIVDWKTSRKRPRREWLAQRLQSRVYPYLLVRAGVHLNHPNKGQSFEPEQVEMIYWFANFPGDPEHFVYSTAQYEEDEAYLLSLIEEIRGLGSKDLPLTTQEGRCHYCSYRSLCQRGVEAGPFDAIEEGVVPGADFDISLDLEQIAEIEY